MNYLGIDPELTGLWLQKLCRYRSITLRDIQEYLGLVYPQSIYRWFRGMALPSLDHLYLLSGLLKKDMDELLIGNRAWKGQRRCCYYLLFCLREKRIKSRNFDESEPERDMVLPPDCDWTSSPMTNAGICDMVVVGLVKKDPTKPETQDRKKGGAVLNEPKHQIYGGRG